VAASGLGRPCGGMEPCCSFAITFSQTSGFADGFMTSSVSSANPAVFSFWLWHVTQYLSNTARGVAAGAATEGAAGGLCLADVWTVDTAAAANVHTASPSRDARIWCVSILPDTRRRSKATFTRYSCDTAALFERICHACFKRSATVSRYGV